MLSNPKLKKTHFSLHFIDLKRGRTVFAHNAETPLIPASNMKLITSAAAIDLLGADYVYETRFVLRDNNLVIIAGGDPLIGDPVVAERRGIDILDIFKPLVTQLRNRNIHKIEGDLIVDDSVFDNIRFHPSWPAKQADKWYTAQVAGANFNDNCLDVKLIPAATNHQLVSYCLTPDTRYVSIDNKCKTKKKGKNIVGASRVPGTNRITLRGSCTAEQIIYVTVDNPSAYFGYVLAEYLLRAGIRVEGKILVKSIRDAQGQLPRDMVELMTYRTPLKNILAECNQRSLNLIAECLFKTLGVYEEGLLGRPGGRQGSWERGRAVVAGFLDRLDINSDQYRIDDGSGLSRNNLVSARCLTAVLAYMHRHPSAKLYRESLATSEVGTLKKRGRFKQKQYQDRIFAKTGYVNGSRCLSGYCRTKAGGWLAFSVLTNRPAASNHTIDRIVKTFMDR